MDDDSGLYLPHSESRWQEDGWEQHVAMATLEEIRYAEQLRLQIRESYLKRPEPAPAIWTISVE